LRDKGFRATVTESAQAPIESFPAHTQNCCVADLDDVDHRLLVELQADAGRTLRELGEVIGLSPSAVQRRIDRYRRGGLLDRLVAVLDPKQTPETLLAVVLVSMERESRKLHDSFQRRLLAAPEVQQLYDVSGAWDYVVIMATTSMHHHNEASQRLIMDAPNVRRYTTLFVLDARRTGSVLPTRRPASTD